MGALLVVELRRFLARRLVRITVALSVLGILIAGVTTFIMSTPASPELLVQGEAIRQREIESCARGDYGVSLDDVPGDQTLREFCENELVPPAEVFGGADPFRLTSLLDVYLGTSFVAMLIAWLLAGSFVGAEWHAKTIGTLLTWESRRIRVILAKAGVAVAMGFVITVLLQALLGLALLPAAVARGSTAGADAAWFRETAWVVLRSGTVAAVGAAVGFALAAMARNTAAALGVGFGYLVVVEMILAGLRPGWQKWMLLVNFGTFMTLDPQEVGVTGRSAVGAGVLLGAYAVGLVAVAAALFRARDVT